MIRPQITPLTLYDIDDSIFDGIVLPIRPFTDRGYDNLYLTGWDMDRETLVNNLLMETAELNVLYTDPVFFKWAVTQWAKKEKTVWQALYETLFFRYNPIWNKDGTIKHTGSNSATPGVVETETKTYNLQDAADHTSVNSGNITTTGERDVSVSDVRHDEVDETVETRVAAFDSNSYQNRDEVTTDRTDHTTDTETTDEDTLETVTDARSTRNSGTDTRTGTETTQHSRTGANLETMTSEDVETGNIGVTSSQELIEREREIAKFNIYDYIIESFKSRFCLLIY